MAWKAHDQVGMIFNWGYKCIMWEWHLMIPCRDTEAQLGQLHMHVMARVLI